MRRKFLDDAVSLGEKKGNPVKIIRWVTENNHPVLIAGIPCEVLARKWLDENQDAIKSYNSRIEANGVFSDGLRQF